MEKETDSSIWAECDPEFINQLPEGMEKRASASLDIDWASISSEVMDVLPGDEFFPLNNFNLMGAQSLGFKSVNGAEDSQILTEESQAKLQEKVLTNQEQAEALPQPLENTFAANRGLADAKEVTAANLEVNNISERKIIKKLFEKYLSSKELAFELCTQDDLVFDIPENIKDFIQLKELKLTIKLDSTSPLYPQFNNGDTKTLIDWTFLLISLDDRDLVRGVSSFLGKKCPVRAMLFEPAKLLINNNGVYELKYSNLSWIEVCFHKLINNLQNVPAFLNFFEVILVSQLKKLTGLFFNKIGEAFYIDNRHFEADATWLNVYWQLLDKSNEKNIERVIKLFSGRVDILIRKSFEDLSGIQIKKKTVVPPPKAISVVPEEEELNVNLKINSRQEEVLRGINTAKDFKQQVYVFFQAKTRTKAELKAFIIKPQLKKIIIYEKEMTVQLDNGQVISGIQASESVIKNILVIKSNIKENGCKHKIELNPKSIELREEQVCKENTHPSTKLAKQLTPRQWELLSLLPPPPRNDETNTRAEVSESKWVFISN